ncbi:calmodulin-like protein 5 [Platysternon megacephalum]|uniref:Calmodulin-like protein 5 n=1 Tax=Platysternon megacephalum TaxID=55544 RepID=A0A4D9ERC4_9SAUR|nr:calmodulin-like protein 5 [Platysternon megacephalum]
MCLRETSGGARRGTMTASGRQGLVSGFPPLPLGRSSITKYVAINSMLDQINSCLDHLEEKNDHLHARLKELLESNRQTRLEFQQQLSEEQNMQADVQGPHTDI